VSQMSDETPAPDSPASIGWGAIGVAQQKLILDHSRNPRNTKMLENPDIHATEVNPFCGDETTFQAHIIDGVLAEVGIHGVGCSICQASLSMLSEAVLHLTPNEASTLSTTFQKMMQGKPIDAEETTRLSDLAGLISVRNYPIRVKCALLAWVTLDQGLQGHLIGV
jgi:nitrogen fixation NifU-like protein